jgi:hypothetical protein
VAILVSATHSFTVHKFGDYLGVFDIAPAVLLTFFLLMAACDATVFAAIKVTIPFTAFALGINLGVDYLADRLAPDRTRLAAIHDEAAALSAAATNTSSLVSDLQNVIARGLEGVEFFTREQELDNLSRDLAKGIEVYKARKAAMAAADFEAMTHEEVLEMMTGLTATSDVDEIAMRVQTLLEHMEEASMTETAAPPEEIMVSLRKIVENLSNTNSAESLAMLLQSGVELVGMAAENPGDPEAVTDLATKVGAAAMQQLTGLDSEGGSWLTADATNSTSTRLQSGEVFTSVTTDGEGGANQRMLDGDLDIELDSAWTAARDQLKISGIMSGGDNQYLVLMGTEIYSEGDTISVDREGTTYWWSIEHVDRTTVNWRPLEARPAKPGTE